MNLEGSRNPLLCGEQARQVGTDLADLTVRARRRYAVASCRSGRAADKVIAFIGGEDEKRVGFVDAVLRERREECRERRVIRLKSGNVSGFSWTVCWTAGMFIMCVRNVSIGDRYAVPLHRGHIRERYRRGHSIETRKPDVPTGTLDDVPV